MRFCGVESDEEEGTEVYDMGDMGREVVGEDERESKGSCCDSRRECCCQRDYCALRRICPRNTHLSYAPERPVHQGDAVCDAMRSYFAGPGCAIFDYLAVVGSSVQRAKSAILQEGHDRVGSEVISMEQVQTASSQRAQDKTIDTL